MRTKSVELRSLGLGPIGEIERYPKTCAADLGGVGSRAEKIWKFLEQEERANPGFDIIFRPNYRTGTGVLTFTPKEPPGEFSRKIDRALTEMRVTNAKRFFK